MTKAVSHVISTSPSHGRGEIFSKLDEDKISHLPPRRDKDSQGGSALNDKRQSPMSFRRTPSAILPCHFDEHVPQSSPVISTSPSYGRGEIFSKLSANKISHLHQGRTDPFDCAPFGYAPFGYAQGAIGSGKEGKPSGAPAASPLHKLLNH